jgi:dethiobiotin synthetase
MNPRYLYIMGAESGVGKSTVCLGILAQLLADGYLPQQLAYIKPMTQCVEQQAVARFCAEQTIACIDIGSLLFIKGFTRDFIDGLTDSSNELLATVLQSIRTIAVGKAVVLIDGIGSPAVGSVVGVSNIDIAALLPCRIIFVGKAGIGAAIDDTVLNVSFIQSKHQHNVGLIYNKIPASDLTDTRHYVSKRIVQLLPNTTPLGFIANHDCLPASQTWFSDAVNFTDWFELPSV